MAGWILIATIVVFVIGWIAGYGYSNWCMTHDCKYRIIIGGKERLYKVNKKVTETWVDGCAVWECFDLKEIRT